MPKFLNTISFIDSSGDEIFISNASQYDAYSEAVPGTIALRDNFGRFKIADPADSSDAATLRYVDTKVDTKVPSGTLGVDLFYSLFAIGEDDSSVDGGDSSNG